MRVRITQLDGKLPNLALMRLAHWHRARGDEVRVTRRMARDLYEDRDPYDRVYASAIFRKSADRIAYFRQEWPQAIIGGTGTDYPITVEQVIGAPSYNHASYEGWAADYSIGFTQRGCRFKCEFCVVPAKEGNARAVGTVNEIWRGGDHPKKIMLLDNDFFGQKEWRDRIKEIRDGDFRVSLSQGVNVRVITQETAEALASIRYSDDQFNRRRLYTAWDSLGDEEKFFKGVTKLERAGIPPKHLMVFMLVGFDRNETWAQVWHRFNRMRELGIKPYPMVFDRTREDLTKWQRWVNLGMYRRVRWTDWKYFVPGTEDPSCIPASV